MQRRNKKIDDFKTAILRAKEGYPYAAADGIDEVKYAFLSHVFIMPRTSQTWYGISSFVR